MKKIKLFGISISIIAVFVLILLTSNWSKAADTTVNLEITGWSINLDGPTSLDLWTIAISSETWTISGQFQDPNYFRVDDLAGDNGGFTTTLQVTALNWPNWASIDNSLIEFKWWATPTKLAWRDNAWVIIWTAIAWIYQVMWSEPVNYIMRDAWENNWLVWKYWDLLRVKITIPPYQAVWSYSWTITFTMPE